MSTPSRTERGLLVFSIWGALGFFGLGFILQGFARSQVGLSLLGVAIVVAALGAHIVVNAIYGHGFTNGEATLGAAAYGVAILVFIVASLSGAMSPADELSGFAVFGVLAAGVLGYLMTRYGLRNAFSRFHGHRSAGRDSSR